MVRLRRPFRPRRRGSASAKEFRRYGIPAALPSPPLSPLSNSAPLESSWWEEAFKLHPTASDLNGHRCGLHQMLTLIAYDITDQKRLHQVAKVCEDWGVRVQYSVFECRLEADSFDRFWTELKEQIDEKFDRVVAYKICLNCARDIRCAGTMTTTEKVVAYVC